MQTVLIHVDTDLGPIGAWSWHPVNGLRQFYPESLDLSISGRARQLIAERDPEVGIVEHFHDMSVNSFSSALDDYIVAVVADSVTLVDIVSEYRRSWNAAV